MNRKGFTVTCNQFNEIINLVIHGMDIEGKKLFDVVTHSELRGLEIHCYECRRCRKKVGKIAKRFRDDERKLGKTDEEMDQETEEFRKNIIEKEHYKAVLENLDNPEFPKFKG